MKVVFSIASNRRDENACIKSVNAVGAIGEKSLEKSWIIANESARFLGRAGKKAAEIKEPWLDDIIVNIVLALTSIGGMAADKNSEIVAVTSLKLLGPIAESSIDRSNIIEIVEDGLNSISIGIATEKGMVQKAGYTVNGAINDQRSID